MWKFYLRGGFFALLEALDVPLLVTVWKTYEKLGLVAWDTKFDLWAGEVATISAEAWLSLIGNFSGWLKLKV